MAVGLAVRLVWALVVMGDTRVTGDGNQFRALAELLAEHGRYIQPFVDAEITTAEKPPLYPFVLAVPAKLGIDGVTGGRVVSCLLGAGTVAVIGLLGRRVGGPRVGLVAAAIAAIYPALFALDSTLRSESLYALLIATCLLLAYRLVDDPTPARALVLGVVIGLAALTRSEALALLVLLLVPAVRLVPRGMRMKTAAVVCAGAALLVVPWLARNWITFDRPTGISTNEGGLLAGANCDESYFSDNVGWWACLPYHDPAWGTNEAVIARNLRSQAFDYATDHSGRVPAVVAARLGRTFGLFRPRQQGRLESFFADRRYGEQKAALVAWYLLAALAVAGALWLRRRAPVGLLLAPVALVVLASVVGYGSFRFRVAADVAVVVLAAYALSHLAGVTARGRRSGRRPPRTTAAHL